MPDCADPLVFNLAFGAFSGAVYGALTGFPLVWLLEARRE
jgi:hypothetical protein